VPRYIITGTGVNYALKQPDSALDRMRASTSRAGAAAPSSSSSDRQREMGTGHLLSLVTMAM